MAGQGGGAAGGGRGAFGGLCGGGRVLAVWVWSGGGASSVESESESLGRGRVVKDSSATKTPREENPLREDHTSVARHPGAALAAPPQPLSGRRTALRTTPRGQRSRHSSNQVGLSTPAHSQTTSPKSQTSGPESQCPPRTRPLGPATDGFTLPFVGARLSTEFRPRSGSQELL